MVNERGHTPVDPNEPVVYALGGHGLPYMGLTKREWLAGMALQGLCTIVPEVSVMAQCSPEEWRTRIGNEAVVLADKTIEALNA